MPRFVDEWILDLEVQIEQIVILNEFLGEKDKTLKVSGMQWFRDLIVVGYEDMTIEVYNTRFEL